MRKSFFSLLLLCLPALMAAGGAKAPAQPEGVAGTYALLPPFLNGWEKDPQRSTRDFAPDKADPQNAALLRELSFTDAENGLYRRGDRTLKIQALRFSDATTAFAAYSYYRPPGAASEKFCNQASSLDNRILIQCTNVVLRIEYDRITAMTPAEVRSLVAQLVKASGTAALPPTTPLHMPRQGISNLRFALGPAGLAHTGTPIPADVIDFSKGAELVTGAIDYADGPALITLVKYPTFALATDRQKAIDAWAKSRPAPPADANPATFYTKRIGPIVAVVTGEIAEPEARTLAERIPYDVTLSQSEPVYTAKDNIGNLVVNILYLSFIIIGFTAICGVAFGGLRILLRRLFPGRYIDRPEASEIIRLDLRE